MNSKPSSFFKTCLLLSSITTSSIIFYYYHNKNRAVEKNSRKETELQHDITPTPTHIQKQFEVAIQEASKILPKLESGDKLLLYGIYKQATIGDATDDKKPSALDITGRYKYDAWCKFRELTQTEAKQRYIQMIQHFSTIDENADIIYSDDEDEEIDSEEEDGVKTNKKAIRDRTNEHGFGSKPSSLLPLELSSDGDVSTTNNNNDTNSSSPVDEQLRNAANWNNMDKIQTILQSNSPIDIINQADENGQTALHFAVDKGNIEMISLLLENGANPNVQDVDGISILMTCVLGSSCSKKEICEMVLKAGADLFVSDCDGLKVKDYILEQQKDGDDSAFLEDILKLCTSD